MRKLFTLLCAMLLTAQFAVAQKNLYVISKTGVLTAYSATKVFFDNDLITFTYGEVTEVTKESFAASVKVALKSSEIKSFSQGIENGVCFSDVNTSPTINDGKIKISYRLSSYTFSINGLDLGTTYYYRAYVKIGDAVYYGDVCNVTTLGTKPNYIIINGHKFVDLGLPSSLLWATCNIGAVIAADDGRYYAWGETTRKDTYNWSTYKYGTSTDDITKYNSTDGKTVLENEDDVAYVNWGDSCRMPTKKEFEELINNCIWSWSSMTTSSGNSVNGYKIFSEKNGNSIFLPVSSGDGSGVSYWSSTLFSYDISNAYTLCLSSNNFYSSLNSRCYCYSVRPVAKQFR